MRIKKKIGIGFFCLLLLACSTNDLSSINSENPPIGNVFNLEQDWRHVDLPDTVVVLGSDMRNVPASERPQMRVSLENDFFLMRHEVTCGEFNALMNSSHGLVLKCSKKDVPATNVTFYDAVLYANELSKNQNMDTAYSYSVAVYDKDKHCVNLEGFVFHPEVNAFRLPTEAEWVYVASKNWDSAKGWTADNSEYKLHPVCSLASENDFCDMMGNAMEWVNDWLGNLQDTIVPNYVGATDGGAFDQRVVKGGSFRNAAATITLFSRGDVYKVTSSSLSDYLGFRLAFGSISNPTWMFGNGKISGSKIVPVASLNKLQSYISSKNIKLAFRDDLSGNLAYIDYMGSGLSVFEIDDSLDVYHPEISPDGKKVAFCTGIEGVSGESQLYVRDLNAEGANLVKLDVKNAAIPRWRVLDNGDTVIVYVSGSGNNSDDAEFSKSSTWQVAFAGGQFGTPQKLFDGAYHGGISEDNGLAVSGSKLLRARIAASGATVMDNARDTVWFGGNQACNVSLAQDYSKRTLFLDFAGEAGKAFVGEKYAVHERLFVADSTGKLIQSVAAPPGYVFDHTEWVLKNGKFVVATLSNANGAHSKIVLMNLSDSSHIELVEGDELWHPSLWIDLDNSSSRDTGDISGETIDPSLDLDSVGVYFTEGMEWTHEVLAIKMKILFDYMDEIEYLCVGSSRVEDGIYATKITSGFAVNMGHPGNDMDASLYIAENYGFNHLKKLKAVVVALDFDLWQMTTEFTEKMFCCLPGFVYDANHAFWPDGLPTGFHVARDRSYKVSQAGHLLYYGSRGYLMNNPAEWGSVLVESDSTWADRNYAAVQWNLDRLSAFLSQAISKGIYVVGVVFPQNPAYKNTGSFGRYGPSRSVAERIMKALADMEQLYPNFVVMDENKMGNHDYTDSMALNSDHLSALGAELVSSRLDSLLESIIK